MKKLNILLAILLSFSMFVTGCSQNTEQNSEVVEEKVEHKLKVKKITKKEINKINNKLDDANFLIRVHRHGVEFALGAEDWVVDSDEVRYYNAKICHGPYSITNKSFGYGVSEDNQAFLEDNYKETLDMFGIDLDSLSAYGMYLMDSYDRLKEPEEEDNNENIFKVIKKPTVKVNKESWRKEFPEIINMIEGENYVASVQNENEINIVNNDGFYGWFLGFKNFEVYPMYKSQNSKRDFDCYNIKMDNFFNYGDFSDPDQGYDDVVQAQMVQQEYISILNKYGVTLENLEEFANYALDHYYETDEEIDTDWEEPDFLLIYRKD